MITVILCSYHGEKYIDAQRASILSQKTEVPFELHEYDDAIRHSGSATNNFLSAIRGENSDSAYYMLSDQDDVWHKDKIDEMYKAIREAEDAYGKDTPLLVFSDASVIDENQNIIADSFTKYEGLSPERTKLGQLLLMNQVTGAACIFNNALKKKLEEHPMPQHAVVHDQWLALIASAFGKIVYLDKPLYDYRQHDSNVLGAKEGSIVSEGMATTESDHKQKSKAAYQALFDQAKEFLEQYHDELSDDQKDVLDHFIRLPQLSKAERIKTILKYDFTYNKPYRTLGELVFI